MINNLAVISGNVGEKREPKMYNKKDGTTGIIMTMPVAVYISKEKTMWIDVVAFDELADKCHTEINKGHRVDVIGRLDFYKYKSDDKEHKVFQINATDIKSFEPKNKS